MKKLIFWLLLLLAGVGLNATPAEDYARTVSPPPATRPAPDPEASSAPARGFTNADQLKLLVNGALTLYQTFISSQNEPACMFEPSCSAFTREAFSRYGILGILMGADRVLRCNGLGYEYYDPADIKDGIIRDPVDKYRLWP
ncbi:MAG: membrane protein insertion efficiency factor YidD [Candidatus Cloacimonetes bacterium]|jgi:putative component of membrane protein insertase Oxa1/YidC/SpoIIIJ protein YidD|nr:membrane protein insertion efficiency factor YidD [Candidatus Cloacimonadota bacterium]MDY0367116.1 membrane protein insertion efficiency factor YidD [Candidatus Syntrophosphaera sp.]HOY85293.1 membrane protein insertion efficiency factor YidD [Candidatus Syntrophosphaera sp.]HPH60941.1 membrane protein insertion efficiency factor YidD [Candidatus Syntrophosphaera sp.]